MPLVHARRSWLGPEGGGGDVWHRSILSSREVTGNNAGVHRRDSRRCGRDTFLGCDPDRHYNRASARLCYPGTTEAGRVGGRGNVRICANCSRNPNIRMRMHDSKPVRLLITLNGTRHRPVHDAHAPASRYADQQECTKLRLLLAVTRRRRSASGRWGCSP